MADVADEIFWQPYGFTWYEGERVAAASDASVAATADAAGVAAMQALGRPVTQSLTPHARLLSLLNRGLTGEIEGREIDIAALLQRWTRGKHVGQLPRMPLRNWPPLLVLVDRSHELATLWDDMDGLVALLRGQLGAKALTVWDLEPGDEPEMVPFVDAPLAGPVVLALTDLGWYLGPSRRRAWLRLGRQLRRAGQRIYALVPVPAQRWTEDLTRVWSPLAWERPSGGCTSSEELPERASRLLDLAAQARRLEPGLLRALRMLLPRGDADVGTEVDAWLHGDLASRCPGATVVRADRAEVRRARFAAKEVGALKALVRETIRGWHAHRRPELWCMEVLALAERGVAVDEAELRRAERLLVGIQCRALRAAESDDREERVRIGHWLDYVAQHAPELFDPATAAGRALQPAWGATHDPDEAPPSADPRLLALGRGTPPPNTVEVYDVRQVGDGLEVWPPGRDRSVPPGCVVGALWAVDRRVYFTIPREAPQRPVVITSPARVPAALSPGTTIELRSDRSSLALRALTRPPWATSIGRDHEGLWADLEVEGVAVRLRWIPPGHFTMGSPPDEPGRYGDEEEHEVVITRGFWLGETPVTQALWQAVMGENPSRFKDSQRPVEMVNYEDAERFLREINRRIDPDADGAVFRLPSDAEWEYACRAGTTTATYAGPMEIRRAYDAPVLDPIAWYGGNSGVDYDLEESADSSRWSGKQHEHSRAGTRKVGQKQANPWGLYDTLGNVWEWCADAWREDSTASRSIRGATYRRSVQTDPHVAGSRGNQRIYRGCGWFSPPRDARAARRRHDPPGGRYGYLGLRLARGQELQCQEGNVSEASAPLDPPGHWDVFIAHANEDRQSARILAENLRRLGLDVFYDEWEVNVGDAVTLRLDQGLRFSRNVVLVVSPTTVSRPRLLEEYASLLAGAVQRGQRLIPVLFGDAEMPSMLSNRRWADLRDKTGDTYFAEVERLAVELRGGLGQSDDSELLKAWRSGDRRAGEQLITRYHDLIRRFIQTRIPEQAVDDLTQEVFTSLVARLDLLREGVSLRGWILGITMRMVADFYRQRRGDPINDENIHQHPDADYSADPLSQVLAHRESRLLLKALRELELEHQLILELYYWEDFSAPELAQAFECTLGTIRSKLRRAKERLSAKLDELTRNDRELGDTVIDPDTWAERLREEMRDKYPRLAGARSSTRDS